MIYSSLIEAVGNTPIIELKRFSEFCGWRVFAKLETLNPGGSHKVRIALGMVCDAEKRGVLRRGSGQTIIEPSGGNTGIGLAIAANLFGYKLVLVIPDNYSKSKQQLLKLYGADVVLSDSRLGNNSHGELATELLIDNPDYVLLNQQRNPANPITHAKSTAQEILSDLEGVAVDCFVGGIGTGGHITGIGSELKKEWKDLMVVGVEPEGCCLLEDRHAQHNIQGLSVGLVPDVLDIGIIDAMLQVSEGESQIMVRRILELEAVSLGLSSGANFAAVCKLEELGVRPGSRVLTMVYDGIESYIEEFGLVQ